MKLSRMSIQIRSKICQSESAPIILVSVIQQSGGLSDDQLCKLNLCVHLVHTGTRTHGSNRTQHSGQRHVMEKVVHLKPPKKASKKWFPLQENVWTIPMDVQLMKSNPVWVSFSSEYPARPRRSGHQILGRTFVEERYVVEDYDDSDESWEDHAVVECGECRSCGERLRLWIVRALLLLLYATADGNLR